MVSYNTIQRAMSSDDSGDIQELLREGFLKLSVQNAQFIARDDLGFENPLTAAALHQLQVAMGHSFKAENMPILALSCVHGSATTIKADYSALAWIGDSALGLITSELALLEIFASNTDTFTGKSTAQLTNRRQELVPRAHCLHRAKTLGLERFSVVGQGVLAQHNNIIPDSILAEQYEALLGAVYIDGGLQAVRKVFLASAPQL